MYRNQDAQKYIILKSFFLYLLHVNVTTVNIVSNFVSYTLQMDYLNGVLAISGIDIAVWRPKSMCSEKYQ